jgi:hypothetical protein
MASVWAMYGEPRSSAGASSKQHRIARSFSHEGVVDTRGVHAVAALLLRFAGARAYGRI